MTFVPSLETAWPLLRVHQRAAAAHLLTVLKAHGYALDGSEGGVGKTYTATAVAAALALPTLALVPKISISAWLDCAQYLGTSFSVQNWEMIRTGRTDFGHWDNTPPAGFERETAYRCQCCQCAVDLENFTPCYTHHLGIHCLETRKKEWNYGAFHWHPGIKFLIFDECHVAGALAGLNYQMMVAAKRQRIPALMLSATPASSPLGLKAIGYLLGLHNLSDFPSWARKHGCRPDPIFHGWKFLGGAEQMKKINADLFPARGVRLRVDDIPDFPGRDISVDLFDLPDYTAIDKAYETLADELRELQHRGDRDVSPDSAITKILRAREKVELLKVPIAVELVQNYLAQGMSVALFVSFSSTLRLLRRCLSCECYIAGDQTAASRQKCVSEFQADLAPVILCNSKAGGVSVSLHDLNGNRARAGIVFPSFSAVEFNQVLYRLRREGGKSRCLYRVILAAKTVETSVYRQLRAKLNNLETLLDGDLTPENLKL